MFGLSPVHLILIVFVLVLFLMPTLIAFKRNHAHKWLVVALTFVPAIGCVAALIWAIVGRSDHRISADPGVFN